MRIVNLMENTKGSNDCLCEHGLSFYIETKSHKLLVDTGASDLFIQNAQTLGIDLSLIDTVILSHGHYDHGGGLLAFMELNSKAKIYIRDKAFGDFYHVDSKHERYIGIKQAIKASERVELVTKDLRIDEELFLFTNVRGRKLWPSGNLVLKEKTDDGWIQDEFEHEQNLVISEEDQTVLISGCAHNGILNIMDKAVEILGKAPDMVISGFHMMQKNGYTPEDIENICKTAEELKQWPTIYYTGHCTDLLPFETMKEIMGEQVRYAHCGDEVKWS